MSPEEVEKIAPIDRTETIWKGYEMRNEQLCGMEVKWEIPEWIKEGDGPHSYICFFLI